MSKPPAKDEALDHPDVLRRADLIPDHALRERESDEFRHSEIAGRVAELVTGADLPLNVVLFGPWGSGKSSFATLLRAALRGRKPKTAFVVYDAWKYSGDALQRSFVTEAADKLAIEDPVYSSELRQEAERTQLDLKQVNGELLGAFASWVALLVAPLCLLVTAAVVASISIVSLIADRSVADELLQWLPYALLPVLAGTIAALYKLVADSTSVKVREGLLTGEAFENRFRTLLAAAKEQHGYQRFVFFIDELDRVAPNVVVETLGVIKNFLDQPNTVFVVAADQEVLERALRSLPQSTPTNEEEPYYSSASEFLDKIFQHQISLPPLRGQRLTAFARDLVRHRPHGIWAELKQARPDEGALNACLYALIPSHVRSPRRVKVLLNNFTTNARVAQARGIEWIKRAEEVAKLTVLQTEFPLFAADLHLEPRLPMLVLDGVNDSLSPRTARLVERHRLSGVSAQAEVETAETDVATEETDACEETPTETATGEELGAMDRLLVSVREQPRLVSVQRENLRRYLKRTEAVPDPGRDLLFLEAGGAAEGLSDTALGELIESEAVENPSAVIEAVRDRPITERQSVVRVLSGMSEHEFGVERGNVITALLSVVDTLQGELGTSLMPAESALGGFLREEEQLSEYQLMGALSLGLAAMESGFGSGLMERVWNDNRLLVDAKRVEETACLLHRLPYYAHERVYLALADVLAVDANVLAAPLRVLPCHDVIALTQSDVIVEALTELLDEADVDEAAQFSEQLLVALEQGAGADDGPSAELALFRLLLRSESSAVYPSIRGRAEAALTASGGANDTSSSLALRALDLAPPDDWELWLEWMNDHVSADEPSKEAAIAALIRVVEALPSQARDRIEVAKRVVRAIVAVAQIRDDDLGDTLPGAIQGTLGSTAWWTDDEAFKRQAETHDVVRSLGKAIGPEALEMSGRLRHEDLLRGQASAGLTPLVVRAMGRWTSDLPPESLADLASRLDSSSEETTTVLARSRIWGEAAALGQNVSEAPYVVTIPQIIAAGRSGGGAQVLIALWLGRRQNADFVKQIILGIRRRPFPRESSAFSGWLETKTASAHELDDLLTALALDGAAGIEWLKHATASKPQRYHDDVVARAISEDVRALARGTRRRQRVEAMVALQPSSSSGQRVAANLVLDLLARKQHVDFDNAIIAVGALGNKHSMGRQIGEAFRQACEGKGWRIPANRKRLFETSKIVLGKKYFESKGRK